MGCYVRLRARSVVYLENVIQQWELQLGQVQSLEQVLIIALVNIQLILQIFPILMVDVI